jgi:hypothetical protein
MGFGYIDLGSLENAWLRGRIADMHPGGTPGVGV